MPAARQFWVTDPLTWHAPATAPFKPTAARHASLPPHLPCPAHVPPCLQWWGWALQTAFVLLTAIYWAAKSRNAGVLIIGACATVLGETKGHSAHISMWGAANC